MRFCEFQCVNCTSYLFVNCVWRAAAAHDTDDQDEDVGAVAMQMYRSETISVCGGVDVAEGEGVLYQRD